MFELKTTTEQLQEFCDRAGRHDFVTLDTEFLREKTYYPRLCLLQMAYPGDGPGSLALFDTLSPQLSLQPLSGLLLDEKTVKVLHAARQDLEIFHLQLGVLPEPLFDTQIAAMVCGYGDQVGYDVLVQDIAGAKTDKAPKITDWSVRPLSERQLRYAAADVDYLRPIYVELCNRLRKNSRIDWIGEEIATLINPSTYHTDPEDAWLRLKRGNGTTAYRAVLCELAKFRELMAQRQNRPRNWIVPDKALLELAGSRPTNRRSLQNSRFLPNHFKSGKYTDELLAAVRAGLEAAPDRFPATGRRAQSEPRPEIEMLRVLLKMKAKEIGVAERLIATSEDLVQVASGNPSARPLQGWRRVQFGEDALELCAGRAALTMKQGTTRLVTL
ncbi:MAG: ribonuclease D [Rhodobacteraceae bacterium]|nr:ribonuclease D [Paracoccaceae bacterium]